MQLWPCWSEIYLTLAPNHTEYYQEVSDLCDEITNLGYDLSSCKYEDNFDALVNNGPESLFEVQYSGNTEYDFWGNNPQSSWLSTFMGPRNSDFVAGSYGWNQLQKNCGQYESGDKRKDLTVLYADVRILTVRLTKALIPIRDTMYASFWCRKRFLRNTIPILPTS